jgi:hypothetical protein
MDFEYFNEILSALTSNDKKKCNDSIEVINEIKKSNDF